MNKQLTVSIGIPACNEAMNIRRLLKTLLMQEQRGFILRDVIVVSDGSTDATVAEVETLQDARIRLIRNSRRRGQTYAQNQIFSQASADIVVLLEADTLPETPLYLSQLVQPLLQGFRLGFVQGLPYPIKPRSLVGKILCGQTKAYLDYVLKHTNSSWFLCSGRGGRAFPRRIYQSLRWPDGVPEDAYAFLWCCVRGFTVHTALSARCLFSPSTTLQHFVAHQRKARTGKMVLATYFPAVWLRRLGMYDRSPLVTLRMLFYFFTCYPAVTIGYIFVRNFAFLVARGGDFDTSALAAHTLRSSHTAIRFIVQPLLVGTALFETLLLCGNV